MPTTVVRHALASALPSCFRERPISHLRIMVALPEDLLIMLENAYTIVKS